MKQKLLNLLLVVIVLAGAGFLLYPTISNLWNNWKQNTLIRQYDDRVKEMVETDFSQEWESAKQYNEALVYNALYAEVFEDTDWNLKDTEYWQVLNVAQDGVMGYLSVPKINIKLAIYHGSGESLLQTGVGHIDGTMLPVGGESTHCVLAGHRGLPSAKLFTDIDQLQMGDMFYIHVLDEVLAYQVDQVLDMVEKDDAEALGAALAVQDGQDQVTLFTCTPYGINSHRLLVRGTRVPYSGEEDEHITAADSMLKAIQHIDTIYFILVLSVVFLFIITIVKSCLKRRVKKENKR